jgi:hypothetical protein
MVPGWFVSYPSQCHLRSWHNVLPWRDWGKPEGRCCHSQSAALPAWANLLGLVCFVTDVREQRKPEEGWHKAVHGSRQACGRLSQGRGPAVRVSWRLQKGLFWIMASSVIVELSTDRRAVYCGLNPPLCLDNLWWVFLRCKSSSDLHALYRPFIVEWQCVCSLHVT